jgi:hypothetical protein
MKRMFKGNNADVQEKDAHHYVISFALLPVVIILTIVTTSLVHYIPSLWRFSSIQYKISWGLERRCCCAKNKYDQHAALRVLLELCNQFLNKCKYPSTWSAFDQRQIPHNICSGSFIFPLEMHLTSLLKGLILYRRWYWTWHLMHISRFFDDSKCHRHKIQTQPK